MHIPAKRVIPDSIGQSNLVIAWEGPTAVLSVGSFDQSSPVPGYGSDAAGVRS